MMKDPTEFKQRFKRWQEGEKVYEAGKILPEVVVTADDPIKKLVEDVNARSNADFVNRAKDPNRTWIQDWENKNKIATHKLSWAEDNGKVIVFPEVQNINGKLHDFTNPKYNHGKWDALDSAIERGDTLQMTPEQAKMYTENYKKYYPKGKTFDAGKPIPKYDGGTDDKTYFPEYEYEATVTPQGTSLEKHKRITNEEDWQKYWGNVGAGYVNKAQESVAKPILDGLKTASYFTPIGNATAFGDLLAANINGDKDEALANAAGLLPQVRLVKGVNKIAQFFNAIPEKSSFKLLRDVLTSPDEVIAARRAGRYPLTFSERRDYVKLLQNEATDAWYNVQDMQDALSSEYPKLFLPGYRIKRPKTIIGGDNIVKRAGLSDNSLGHYNSRSGDVVLRRRELGSLLPIENKYGFKGLSAHEYQHAVRDYDSYLLEEPFTFSTEVDYDKLNPNFTLSPLFKNVITPIGASGRNRTAWQMSPDEFLSDYWKYRAASDPSGVLVPPFHKMNDSQKNEVVDFISRRFDLSQQTVRDALYDISFFGGYDKGKSIHINPANKGKFNTTKKRTGKTTEQLAHSKNPLTRKRAIFALNSRKFEH